MYILLEYTRIIKPLSQCFDTQTIVIIIHRGRDVKILLLTILLDIVFKTMKINKIHYKVSKNTIQLQNPTEYRRVIYIFQMAGLR